MCRGGSGPISKEIWELVARDTRHPKIIAAEYKISKSNVYAIQKRYGLVYPYRPEDKPEERLHRKN
jgi:hypothetical protein